jgi:AraC family transcriptional regulator
MEAKIIRREGMLLVGMACDVTLEDVQTKRMTINLAEQFMARKSEINHVINTREVFGLSTDPENYDPETDKFEYFIGVEVSSSKELPKDMVYREVPKNEYIVFTFKGSFENAGQVHNYLYTKWLQNNDYKLSDLYNIEIYDERFKGPESEESITDIYFPIEKK